MEYIYSGIYNLFSTKSGTLQDNYLYLYPLQGEFSPRVGDVTLREKAPHSILFPPTSPLSLRSPSTYRALLYPAERLPLSITADYSIGPKGRKKHSQSQLPTEKWQASALPPLGTEALISKRKRIKISMDEYFVKQCIFRCSWVRTISLLSQWCLISGISC